MKWRELIERQILKARAEGQLDDLEGAGKPLPTQTGDAAEAAGFRMMAEAGVVPREIELRKALEAQRRKLADTSAPDARKAEMSKLADLELRLALETEARRKFLKTS